MWGHRGRRQLLTAAAKYQIVYFWKGVLSVPPMFRRPDDISRIFLKTVELQLHQRPPSTWCFSLISGLLWSKRCGFPSFHCTFLCAAKSTEVGKYKGLFFYCFGFRSHSFPYFPVQEGELVSIVRKVSWCWCWCWCWCAGR